MSPVLVTIFSPNKFFGSLLLLRNRFCKLMSVCLYHYPTTDLVNDFLGSLCTSISVLYTHSDREVIKLLPTQILSCTTHVPPSMQSDTPLLVSTDVYHVQNLASTFPVNLIVSPYPILVQDSPNVPRFFYSFEDFCYMLHFKRVFYVNSKDSNDEIGQWCYGAYKRVDHKVKPVPGRYPEDARVIQKFPENPLDSLVPLTPLPPDFIPTKKLTNECLALMKLNPDGFLWPEEEKPFAHVMQLNEAALAFDESECSNFRSDYFSPYIIPVLPHKPWEYRNIPIPPGIRERVIQLLRDKIAAGLYEPAQSSYRSKWFCIMKKNGKIRIVHDLQPLNKVTIRDAGVPPILDDFVEPFARRQCYTVFDLFSGFDACCLHPDS